MSSSIFLSCSNPYTVSTSKGLQQVPCGHCVQCLQKKVSATTLLLDLESQRCDYVEMINLTYNDDCIPYIDFNDDSLASFCEGETTEIFPVKFGSSRKILKYNPRTKKYYTAKEKISDFGTAVSTDWSRLLQKYNSRVDEYYQRYPGRKRGIARLKNHVPILYSTDLKKYLYRLRQFLKKYYGIEIRFFAVGEYGSNSLRPHWHILLFHNSKKLRESFRDVIDLAGNTKRNPRQCCRELYLHSLWLHGDTTTKCTDKHCSSYVAGYFNQHDSNTPLVKDFPSKAYHSQFLGVGKISESQKVDFVKENWKSFITRSVVSKSGIKKDVSVSSALYSQLDCRFTGYAAYHAAETYSLLSDVFSIYNATQVNYNNEVELYNFYLSLYNFNFTNARLIRALSSVRSYVDNVVNPILQDPKQDFTLSSLNSLFYASIRLYKIARRFDLHPYTYLCKLNSFKSYINLHRLNDLYSLLQSSPTLTEEYYSCFDVNSGIHDFHKVKYKPVYLSMLCDATKEYEKSIKHREVVDSYINSQLDI
jgi:hypothetical protein